MRDELVQFGWEVNQDGYEIVSRDRSVWVKTLEGRQERRLSLRFLCDVIGPTYQVKPYALDEETGMFRTFSCLRPAETDIRAFASKYGRLGGNTQEWVESGAGEPPTIGEQIGEWQREIGLIRQMVYVWDCIQNRLVEELSAVIHRPDKDHVYYTSQSCRAANASDTKTPYSECIASPEHHGDLLRKMPPNDLLQPALYLIQRKVNEKLNEHNVAPKLLWNNPSHRELGLYMSPSSLIGAIWLQFAYAIVRNPKFGRCEQCKKWFEFTRGKRLGAKFCGDSCRVRFHNANKKDGEKSQ